MIGVPRKFRMSAAGPVMPAALMTEAAAMRMIGMMIGERESQADGSFPYSATSS